VKRFWEIIITARGGERIYCYPFLLFFRMITPLYQYFSRRNLQRRLGCRSGGWKAQVISIGNIMVGGSKKTPVVIWLAQHLLAQKKKVTIVHSGYGRASKKELVIPSGGIGEYPLALTGDEVQMMGTILPEVSFAIGRDKKKMVGEADRTLSPDVILIDDGYQRLDIAKDVDVLMYDAMNYLPVLREGFRHVSGLFPGGIYRESLSAVERADAIFLVTMYDPNSKDLVRRSISELNPDALVVVWCVALSGVKCAGRLSGLDEIKSRKPFLFAGIGSYPRLLLMLEEAGIMLSGDYSFGDHYDYDKSDIDHIRRMAADFKADCYLTTAKDAVKLPHDAFDKPLYILQLSVEPEDKTQIDTLLERRHA
jgi:tetraacyldisaccharide 4'-kinase